MAELDQRTPETTETPETPEAPEAPRAKGRWGKKNKPGGATISPEGGYIPGEPKDNFFADQWRIFWERRALRKHLKSKGITSRKDFEAIAESLGLVMWKGWPFLFWWRYFWRAVLRDGVGLKRLMAAAAALLGLIFLMSWITEVKGSFTINLTADMLRAGFVLHESREFTDPQTRLFSERLEQVSNITLGDIPKDVDTIDGQHNGRNHIAYTFYIRNEGEDPADYAWYMNLLSETLDVGQAVWIMLFQDGDQLIYAKRSPKGEAEELYGFREAPFQDAAYDTNQYYLRDGRYGIVTTPYANEEQTIVAQGLVTGVEPGEYHKYTVVIWVEGYDPECTDAIFGGFAKYSIDFERVNVEDNPNIFSGVYRTEYKNYGLNPETID